MYNTVSLAQHIIGGPVRHFVGITFASGSLLRSYTACSHEHRTVNYPEAIIAPGQANRQLITMNLSEFVSFLHKLLQKMNFKHVYLLLVLSGNIYWEIYSEH